MGRYIRSHVMSSAVGPQDTGICRTAIAASLPKRQQYLSRFERPSAADHRPENQHSMESSRRHPFFLQPTPLIVLCLLLVTCNVYLYGQIRRLQLAVDDHGFSESLNLATLPETYAKYLKAGIYSRGKSWKQFHTYTEYSNVNQSISDIAWSGFTTNGFVAIPHREAARAGLPAAEDFPDDASKGVYVLSGFHQLHCVVCNT